MFGDRYLKLQNNFIHMSLGENHGSVTFCVKYFASYLILYKFLSEQWQCYFHEYKATLDIVEGLRCDFEGTVARIPNNPYRFAFVGPSVRGLA